MPPLPWMLSQFNLFIWFFACCYGKAPSVRDLTAEEGFFNVKPRIFISTFYLGVTRAT